MRTASFIMVLLCLIAGCHPKTTSGGIEVYDSIWQRTDRDLRFRAAMDLHCQPTAMQLTLVQRQGRYPTHVHAAGCGMQALYSRQLRRHHGSYTDRNSQWIIESSGPGNYAPQLTESALVAKHGCRPLPDPGEGCKFSHYYGFMKYDADRIFRACDGQAPVDVTPSLPSDHCNVATGY